VVDHATARPVGYMGDGTRRAGTFICCEPAFRCRVRDPQRLAHRRCKRPRRRLLRGERRLLTARWVGAAERKILQRASRARSHNDPWFRAVSCAPVIDRHARNSASLPLVRIESRQEKTRRPSELSALTRYADCEALPSIALTLDRNANVSDAVHCAGSQTNELTRSSSVSSPKALSRASHDCTAPAP
jgi:hypothetical protein